LSNIAESQIRSYMHALLVALRHVHSVNYVHRDIKPANFLVHPRLERFLLVDFGLAEPAAKLPAQRTGPRPELARPGGRLLNDTRPAILASRAGTRGFRAPEVLLRSGQQGTGLDIWAAGVILLSLLTGRYPFFHARDDTDALIELAAMLGPASLQAAAAACDRVVFFPPGLADWYTPVEHAAPTARGGRDRVRDAHHGRPPTRVSSSAAQADLAAAGGTRAGSEEVRARAETVSERAARLHALCDAVRVKGASRLPGLSWGLIVCRACAGVAVGVRAAGAAAGSCAAHARRCVGGACLCILRRRRLGGDLTRNNKKT
jgi:hypothetical protein